MKMFENWIRCNKCFITHNFMKNANRTVSLTQCGHIFCFRCIRKVLDTQKCTVCENIGVQSMELTDPKPVAVQNLFDAIIDRLERITTAARFQFGRMIINFERLDELEKKYQLMKQAYAKKANDYEILQQHYANHVHQQNQLQQKNATTSRPRHEQYTPNIYIESSEVRRANPDYWKQKATKQMSTFRRNPGYITDSSNGSTPMARGLDNTNMRNIDKIFKIPYSRRVPTSIESPNASSIETQSNPGIAYNLNKFRL